MYCYPFLEMSLTVKVASVEVKCGDTNIILLNDYLYTDGVHDRHCKVAYRLRPRPTRQH